MKRLFLFLIVSLLLAMVALPAFADDDTRTCTTDPDDGSRLPECGTRADNECYEGGTMAGKCDNEWLWKAGWEIARFNDGRITREQVNAEWAFLLPPPVEEESAPFVFEPGCYVPLRNADYFYDFEYHGPINTADNYTMWSSTDGSCTGSIEYTDAVILATSEAEALALCAVVLAEDIGNVDVDLLSGEYVGVPANLWDCYID
jgi:hypothetical protein